MSNERSDRSVPTEAVGKVLEAATAERKALRVLLREHRDLQVQNLELVQQLVEKPDPAQEGASKTDAIRFGLMEAENSELTTNYQKLLQENNNLFKLYIASHRLHSTLALGEVLDVISEIILNLVGADAYSIQFFDEPSGQLLPVVVRGIERDAVKPVKIGEGIIGSAVTSHQSYSLNAVSPGDPPDADHPLAVIPLRTNQSLVGAVALYRLLSHKPELRDVDFQLFDYMATHAAMALNSAQLYTASERKVSKMKEFLNLMQPPAAKPGTGENPTGGSAR
ncbi:MAG: GAF domain-containing protein [Acidobacteria bacterium]|uniref:GAF domain-containing protein n=1 Tax=Candidatus Polarisedimenticola svalbardensis TaxID=2886004 RepID=A0A8J7C1E2_9BACT|nr:GAF domain-containing protein [Candidatus Polarisedimenticola svalbardensis]